MTDSRDHLRTIHLSEYEQLRNEINNRTQLLGILVAVQIAALGGVLSVAKDLPDAVVGLAAVSSLLWLLWIDHTSQIYKIAAYIGLRLAPRLSEGDEEALAWEHFLRTLEQGDKEAEVALFGRSSRGVKILRTQITGALIFGASPPILILGFIRIMWGSLLSLPSLRVEFLVLAFIVWLYALSQYWLFVKTRKAIDQALLRRRS